MLYLKGIGLSFVEVKYLIKRKEILTNISSRIPNLSFTRSNFFNQFFSDKRYVVYYKKSERGCKKISAWSKTPVDKAKRVYDFCHKNEISFFEVHFGGGKCDTCSRG